MHIYKTIKMQFPFKTAKEQNALSAEMATMLAHAVRPNTTKFIIITHEEGVEAEASFDNLKDAAIAFGHYLADANEMQWGEPSMSDPKGHGFEWDNDSQAFH
jgi:hypothetical protein